MVVLLQSQLVLLVPEVRFVPVEVEWFDLVLVLPLQGPAQLELQQLEQRQLEPQQLELERDNGDGDNGDDNSDTAVVQTNQSMLPPKLNKNHNDHYFLFPLKLKLIH